MFELDPNLLALLGRVQDRLLDNPRCKTIFLDIRKGELSLEEGVHKLVQVIREEGLSQDIQGEAASFDMLTSKGHSETPRPLVMATSTGIPQINPKIEAALAERAYLDGDVPEFRTGPLPEGAEPAVPVKTDSLDPVYVGEQLRVASEEISGLILSALEDHSILLRKALSAESERSEGDSEAALAQVHARLPAPTGVIGYEAGKLPELRAVQPLSSLNVHSLSPPERQQRAFKALTSTQGRRSLTAPIANKIVSILKEQGIEVQIGHPDEKLSSWSWVTQAFGAEDLSDSFPFPLVAAEVMATHFLEVLKNGLVGLDGPLVLEVNPRADISMRLFGWEAHIGRGSSSC